MRTAASRTDREDRWIVIRTSKYKSRRYVRTYVHVDLVAAMAMIRVIQRCVCQRSLSGRNVENRPSIYEINRVTQSDRINRTDTRYGLSASLRFSLVTS